MNIKDLPAKEKPKGSSCAPSIPSNESVPNKKEDPKPIELLGEPITTPCKYIQQEGVKPTKADIQISKPATFDSTTVSLQLTVRE